MPLLEGVYAAAVTPRRLGVQDINLGVMWEIIDFLCASKVQGIALLGSTGEFVHFSPSERMRMMGLAPKRSRVPVLINVSYSTLDGCVELAQAAAASGAAGVLLMPPYFYRYEAPAIVSFYRKFVEDAQIPIPTFVYNIPQFSNPVDIETIESLIRDGVVHGVKDSSGDWTTMERMLALREQTPFTLMCGNDRLSARSLGAGASGVVSGVASAVPELVLALQRSIAAGNAATTDSLNRRLHEFIERVEAFPVPVGIKEATSLRGLKTGPHAIPLAPGLDKSCGEFREWFKAWLPETLSECKRA